jgi:hypothetical protein
MFFRILLAAMALGASAAFAQTTTDNFELSDIPTDDVHPYFGVGGGFIMQLLSPNLEEIDKMTKPLGIGSLGSSLVQTGGAGFISAPFGKHMRIGGMGMSGFACTSADVIDTVVLSGTGPELPTALRRTIQVSIGYGGVTWEYVIPLGFTRGKVLVVGGMQLGVGSMNVQYDQTSSDPRTWEEAFHRGASANITHNIHATYVALEPYVNVEWAAMPFLMIRAGAGYHGTIMHSWTIDREIGISGVPSINGNGLGISGGLFLGIFR